MPDYEFLIHKYFKLKEFKITDIKDNEHDMRIYIEKKDKPNVCPHCGVVNPTVRVHGSRMQEVRDENYSKIRVGLMLKRKRYKCMECGETFYELCDSIEPKARLTKRLEAYIAEQSEKRSFTSLQKELDISDTTIASIFKEHIKDLPNYQKLETPQILAIDEVHLRGDYRGVICNGEQHTLMDLLVNRDKETIINYLQNLKEPSNVQIVTMDMWKPYRDAVYAVLPNAYVVIDQFHVVKKANEALDIFRKSQKKNLGVKRNKSLKKQRYVLLRRPHRLKEKSVEIRDNWFSEIPDIQVAYNLKESLFNMYKCKTKEEAMAMYEEWKHSIPKGLPQFKKVARTIDSCKKEVFNYFDGFVTNAIAEGLVSHIRDLDRFGRGYDFEILRAKAIFCLNHKTEQPRYGSRTMSHMLYSNFYDNLLSDDEPKDYGVSLDELKRAINAGFFD